MKTAAEKTTTTTHTPHTASAAAAFFPADVQRQTETQAQTETAGFSPALPIVQRQATANNPAETGVVKTHIQRAFETDKQPIPEGIHAKLDTPQYNAVSVIQRAFETDRQPVTMPEGVQMKLSVSQPNDPHEHEADHTAERVMRMTDTDISPKGVDTQSVTSHSESVSTKPTPSVIAPILQQKPIAADISSIQRQAATLEHVAPVEDKKEPLQRKANDGQSFAAAPPPPLSNPTDNSPKNADTTISRAANNGETTATTTPSFEATLKSRQGLGSPMPDGIRSFMEPRFGADFSRVRLHTDHNAARLTRQVQAQAFAFGDNIYFANGKFSPNTQSGQQLLAHELTHTIQQGSGIMREMEKTGATSVCSGEAASDTIEAVKGSDVKTDIPNSEKESKTAKPTADKGLKTTQEQPEQAANQEPTADAGKKSAKAVKAPAEDSAFKDLAHDTKKAKKSQDQHDKSEDIAKEAQLSANNPKDKTTQMIDANKVLGTEEKLSNASFSKDAFKENVKKLIKDQLPKNEEENKDSSKNIEKITEAGKEGLGQQGETKEILSNTATNQPSGEKSILFEKPVAVGEIENPGRKATVGEPKRAVPKPVAEEEVKMDEAHSAESLDKAMEDDGLKQFDTKLNDDHLGDYDGADYPNALKDKQDAQVQICEIPQKNRDAEHNAHEKASEVAQQGLNKTMGGKFAKRKDSFGQVQDRKDAARQKDEESLATYYTLIAGIYEKANKDVQTKLADLDTRVSTLFEGAMTIANDLFKKKVQARLDDYYGVGLTNLSEEDEDAMERAAKKGISGRIALLKQMKASTDDPKSIAMIDSKIRLLSNENAAIETIPERIFREEKATFLNLLDTALDGIGGLIEKTFTEAKAIIEKGKSDIDEASKALPTNLQAEAAECTGNFTAKFEDLDKTLSAKQKEIEERLAKDYVTNVGKLKTTFETIRAESAMPWWQKAWNAIKKIAMVIYDLGKLLVNVLIKAVSVIGDIIAHPIRFFGNLIKGIGKGFSDFVDHIGTHLENIIFKLILGAVPAHIKMPDTWDPKGIFGFALDLLDLNKESIREKAVTRFGEPVVHALEQTFDLFILFKNEGFAGLWEHIKEKIGDLKDQVIGQVKSFLTESVVKAAIKFLLSALTPVSGFIKACESLISVAKFFLENLKNILQLLDSILDSFIDIAKGNIEGAAKKVEGALANILLIGIKFLAALVGVSFDKISEKISRVFNAIRTPVNRAITWLFDKAYAFAEKTGLVGLVKKGKAAFDKGKDKLKETAKTVGGKILGFFGVKSTFKDEKGKTHSVAYEESGTQIVLIVRSTPASIGEFIEFYKTEYPKEIKTKPKSDYIEKLEQLHHEMEDIVKKADTKDNKEKLLGIKVDIAYNLGLLMKGNRKVGRSLESYELEGMVGKKSQLPKPTGDDLEGDHQPQTALLNWAKKYLEPTLIEDWTGGSNGQKAYAILLHKTRHAKGATHSTFAKPTDNIKAYPNSIKDRKLVVKILKDAMKEDAKIMIKDVYEEGKYSHQDVWNDILEDTTLATNPEKEALISKIRKNVKEGEDSIKQQPLDNLIG